MNNAHKPIKRIVLPLRQAVTPSTEKGSDRASAQNSSSPEIKIGKTVVSRDGDETSAVAEIFTMTIGKETIDLLPLKNWIQLDSFKWRARGILPRTPAGLEITWDQLKVAGETVSTWDPQACSKIEKAIKDWLSIERNALETARPRTLRASASDGASLTTNEDLVRFKLDVSNPALPRLKCLEGTETVKVVALNQQGFDALFEQGLMQRPESLKVGALHDWVELDGQMFRFADRAEKMVELENALNQRCVVKGAPAAGHDVLVFVNPASPSGFDIQFPATPNGLVENRKRHLNEETIQLLQDPERCRVLRRGITARFAPPDLVFKVKTAGGGERYIEQPENIVTFKAEDGQQKSIDLGRPVSLLKLGAAELTVVLNDPAINRRANLAKNAPGGNQK